MTLLKQWKGLLFKCECQMSMVLLLVNVVASFEGNRLRNKQIESYLNEGHFWPFSEPWKKHEMTSLWRHNIRRPIIFVYHGRLCNSASLLLNLDLIQQETKKLWWGALSAPPGCGCVKKPRLDRVKWYLTWKIILIIFIHVKHWPPRVAISKNLDNLIFYWLTPLWSHLKSLYTIWGIIFRNNLHFPL